MHEPRYNTDGPWLKGQTHVHSTCSDGTLTYRELAERYASAGYDFIFATDHNVPATIESEPDLPLLALNGIEVNNGDYMYGCFHVVGLGVHPDIRPDPSTPLPEAIRLLKSAGVFTILAHPAWLNNSGEDVLRYGFDGVEVFNNLCYWDNGKGDSSVLWDRMLVGNHNVLGFASDDAHLTKGSPSWNGGWIMVNAQECSREAIIAAIRRGHFYSSCGPEIHSIHTTETSVRVRTSPARTVRLVGSTCQGRSVIAEDENGLTEVEIETPPTIDYWRLEVEDFQRRRAWTNTLLPHD